ncbi:hypothetical protein P7C70_g3610, partial [Phenoliferia sp. Uapishka_3]
MPRFNEEQTELLEKHFQEYGNHMSEKHYRTLLISKFEKSRTVEEPRLFMEVGKWLANRRAKEEGRPRAKRKAQWQLDILEQSFADEAYPIPQEYMRLMSLTSLTRKVVQTWFINRRKTCLERGGVIHSAIGGEAYANNDLHESQKLWREWDANEEELSEYYVAEYLAGRGEESRMACMREGESHMWTS